MYHGSPQGGEATAKRTCPLWSDNKAIHEEELAKAAEEARQKLEKDKITLDIDPLKGIAKPAALVGTEIFCRRFSKMGFIRAQIEDEDQDGIPAKRRRGGNNPGVRRPKRTCSRAWTGLSGTM